MQAQRLLHMLRTVTKEEQREAQRRMGARIAGERLRQGISQQELADALGLQTARAIRNLESGQTNPVKHLDGLALAFKKPRSWFYGETDDSGPMTAAEANELRRQIIELTRQVNEMRHVVIETTGRKSLSDESEEV